MSTVGSSRSQNFVMALGIECNQPVRHLQDRIGGTVIVFEPNDSSFFPVGLEVENVLHFRTAPTIDRLVVITHNAKIAVIDGKSSNNSILSPVRVLVLVHQDVVVTS